MAPRKRSLDEVDAQEVSQPPSLLRRIRNNWRFASLMQFIHIFGKALKIDDKFDVEDFETECLKPPPSPKLCEIGLCFLKFVSSHRGLTNEIFDEYTRRQYLAKAPQKNPFGEDEEPKRFADFDIFTKLKVLHQLSTWTLWNPDRMREKLELKDETELRMEPLGWDDDERSYFLLDDDRLYRMTEAPLPEPPKATPKAKSKPKPKSKRPQRKGQRSSKRQKLANGAAEDSPAEEDQGEDDAQDEAVEEHANPEETDQPTPPEKEDDDEDDGLGGAKWELVAITLEEYQAFVQSIRRSRDRNTQTLYQRMLETVMPHIESIAERQARKVRIKQKELENMEKLAFAKRSSRIAGKAEKEREREQIEAEERKRKADREMARAEQEKQKRIERERESRIQTREQRLKEREVKRILYEEELEKLKEEQDAAERGEGRISERHAKSQMEAKAKELEQIKAEDEEEWYFDCSICGVHGKNYDDGTHIVACEKCGVWQHSKCHGIDEEEADKDEFQFLCNSCSKPKITSLKINMTSSSPPNIQEDTVMTEDGPAPAEPVAAQPATAQATPPKKKRGRPRKEDTDDQPKKKRGRPRKEDTGESKAPAKKRKLNGQADAPAIVQGSAPSNGQPLSPQSNQGTFAQPASPHTFSPGKGAYLSNGNYGSFVNFTASQGPYYGQQSPAPQHRPAMGHFPTQGTQNSTPSQTTAQSYGNGVSTQPYQSQNHHSSTQNQPQGVYNRPHDPFRNDFGNAPWFPQQNRPRVPSPLAGGLYNQPSASPQPFNAQTKPEYESPIAAIEKVAPYVPPEEAQGPNSLRTPASSSVPFTLPPDSSGRAGVLAPPVFAATPTPALSATQGNTDVRFAPTHEAGSPSANTYAPVASQPAPAAYSPTKPSSSPPQHLNSPPTSSAHGLLTNQQDKADTLPSILGLPKRYSPSKEDHLISPITRHELVQKHPSIADNANGGNSLPPAPTLSQAPALSPTLDAQQRNLEPPIKKTVPEKPQSPTANLGLGLAADSMSSIAPPAQSPIAQQLSASPSVAPSMPSTTQEELNGHTGNSNGGA